ncbi:MAG: glycosyltransferase [Betaproteobacteria bacterium]|nr:glycosyltransferase [Betaproteobacteria bacterium]
MANFLFVHQNFPGQYRHLAPALARSKEHRVIGVRIGDDTSWQGISVRGYRVSPPGGGAGHPWLTDLQPKLIRAEAMARLALKLREENFVPDAIIAHPGWGETLLLPDVWPGVPIGLYCEFFYSSDGADVGFDPEFPPTSEPLANSGRLRLKNVNQLLAMEDATRGISPTQWQRSLYPARLQPTIDVVHDGIDTNLLAPKPQVTMRLNDRLLTRNDEIITFVNRNLEPYRGYHVFMRALPELLRRRPSARVLIVGGDGTSYGAAPPTGKTWRNIFLDEVRDRIDLSRVHFVGKLGYPDFVQLLQLSRVHVYLTYPFVLSWSLLEAMSIECAIVASRTSPVQEVITDGEHGLLADFFDTEGLVEKVCRLLDDPALRARLGGQARDRVRREYDLATRCLPRQLEWVNSLIRG